MIPIETDDNMTTSTSGRYVPPAIEAASAQSIGLLVIIIILIFLTSLILLDLTTIRRDVSWLFNNIRLQKRLWQAKRRLRAAKKAKAENHHE